MLMNECIPFRDETNKKKMEILNTNDDYLSLSFHFIIILFWDISTAAPIDVEVNR